MAAEIFENIDAMSETAFETYKKHIKTCLDVSEQLVEEQTELISALRDTAAAKASKVTGAKDVAGFVASQAELAQECFQQVLKSSQSCAEIVAEAGKFYQALFEAGVKSANSNFGAPKAAKKKAS